jgi:hypothetical protein
MSISTARRSVSLSGTIFLVLAIASTIEAQVITLPMDAEYQGALFNRLNPITMFASGRLMNGVLKTDYHRDGLTFSSASNINFYEDGRVRSGTIKTDIAIGPFTFAAGALSFHPNGRVNVGVLRTAATDANLSIPANSTVTFTAEGKVGSVSNISVPYVLMGRSIRGNASLDFDPGGYRLRTAVFFQPQIVARLITSPDVFGSSISVPVVVPALSQMDIRTGTTSGEAYDRWIPVGPSTFVLNGMDFGVEPVLFIRDMRLVRVQIRQNRVIAGRSFNASDYVWLTEAGTLVP